MRTLNDPVDGAGLGNLRPAGLKRGTSYLLLDKTASILAPQGLSYDLANLHESS